MEQLQHRFVQRDDLVAYVKELAPWAEGGVSDTPGAKNGKELGRNKILLRVPPPR